MTYLELESVLNTEGDLFTVVNGEVAPLSRASLAADPAFGGLFVTAASGDTSGATDVTNFNAATAAATAVGGTVLLGPGVFYFNARVDVPSNVTVCGSGWATILRATAANATGLLRMRGAANVTVRDLAVDGGGNAAILISTELPVTTTVAVGHTIQRVHFTGSDGTCCRVINPVDDYAFVDNTIDDVDEGLSFQCTPATTSTGIRVERNNIRNITGTGDYHGIQLFGAALLYEDVRVCDNIVDAGAGSIPIEVGRCTNAVISGNIVGPGTLGISTGSNVGVDITDNIITGQSALAVEAGDSTRVRIAGNVCFDCAALFVESGVVAGYDLSIVDNVFVGTGLSAAAGGYVIKLNRNIGVHIEGNYIRSPDYVGAIKVGEVGTSADNVTIRNNTIIIDTANSQSQVINVSNADDCTVEGNKVIISRDLVAGDEDVRAIQVSMSGTCNRVNLVRNEVVFTGSVASAPNMHGIGTILAGSAGTLPGSTMIGNRVIDGAIGFVWNSTSTDAIVADNEGRSCTTEWGTLAGPIFRRTRRDYEGTAAPTTGTWVAGDRVWNTAPAGGGVPGWVCTTGGTPGTWKAMAVLAA